MKLKYFFLLVSFPIVLLANTPETILKEADEIRNPSESYKMAVRIENSDGTHSKFDVMINGNSKTLIKTLEPIRDRGRNLLMLDENMWVYIPNLKRAVRVALSQKLTGEAANGDISRMRWSGDYDVTIKSETDHEIELSLKAKKKGLTYEALSVFIERKSYRPIRALLFSVSGKLMKKTSYLDYKSMAGKERPSRMVIVDALMNDRTSTIIIESMETQKFPETLFNQNALK